MSLAALAQVIEDRAKREGIVWFLQRMHESICTLPKEPDSGVASGRRSAITKELREHWLPATCSLAEQTDAFLQYGGGNRVLEAFRGAIVSDLKGWPGAAVGLGIATLYWRDLQSRKKLPAGSGTLFDCALANPQSPHCAATDDLRAATEKLVSDLLAGSNAAASLYEYGGAINGLNTTGLFSPELQLAACASSVQLVFQEYGPAVAEATPGRIEQSEALLLSSLVSAPACFRVTGKGWRISDCPAFDPSGVGSDQVCKKGVTQFSVGDGKDRLERLTTLQRWAAHIDGPGRGVLAQAGAMQNAWEAYRASIKSAAGSTESPLNEANLDVAAVENAETFAQALRAAEAYSSDMARKTQRIRQLKVLQSAATLAHTSVDLGVALTRAGRSVSDSALFPGLGSTPDVTTSFDGAEQYLLQLSGALGTIEAALAEDWGQVVPRAIASARMNARQACGSSPECGQFANSLSRFAGVLVALASESDPDRVAEALDAAAMPIGGWRRKNIQGATTVTVAAFPGLILVGGERRWGQYGATVEHGGDGHWIAPSLSMPVGVDIAKDRHWKLFISLLDPAAYLQYDPEKEGRLPGAQLTTALAPGLAYRWAPWESPVSFNPFVTYRPGFRAWESSWDGPGANALQVGIAVSVDVTLFNLYTKDPAGPNL